MSVRNEFYRDASVAQATARQSVNYDRSKAQTTVWERIWLPFLKSLNIDDPLLRGIEDKIPILCVCATRIRDGRLSRSRQPVSGKHAADEIFQIAATFTLLGAPDPRKNSLGNIDPRLSRMYRTWRNSDPAPSRVKPCPIQILHQAQHLINTARQPSPYDVAAMDMAWIAFFFLLRINEWAKSRHHDPLRLRDINFVRHGTVLDWHTCTPTDLFEATHVTVTFDTQKNRVRGETVAHARTAHQWACPVRALARRFLYLRLHGANRDTFLCSIYLHGTPIPLQGKDVTSLLRKTLTTMPHLNLRSQDLTARSLRSGGAMALLLGRVSFERIRLQGRWKSDAIFRYLHALALPLVDHLSSTMVHHGEYDLLNDEDIPPEGRRIIQHDANLATQWQAFQASEDTTHPPQPDLA